MYVGPPTYVYNTHVRRTTRTTPFELVLSPPPPEFSPRRADGDAPPSNTRFEWQKMMNNLNELRQAQKGLVFELARSNERIKELERDAERSPNGSKAKTSVAKSTATKVISNGDRNKALATEIVRIPDYSGNTSENAPPATSGQQTQRSKKSWAEIAKTSRPRLVDVSKTVQDRICQSRDILKDVIYRPKPRPTAVTSATSGACSSGLYAKHFETCSFRRGHFWACPSLRSPCSRLFVTKAMSHS